MITGNVQCFSCQRRGCSILSICDSLCQAFLATSDGLGLGNRSHDLAEIVLDGSDCTERIVVSNWIAESNHSVPVHMKALKCITLGGIHIHHALSHIEQQVPRTFHTHNDYRQAVYTAHARTSASLPLE